ncbi:MAG: ABC transporter permease subunit [Anaerolineales bacterium]|nr:ABC transporter permease subunit [Anaerolineales bacterium]
MELVAQDTRTEDESVPQKRRRKPIPFGTITAYLLLTLGAVVMIAPFLWMILTSFKTLEDSYRMNFIPEQFTLQAYFDAWSGERIQSMFGRWYLNSLLVTGIAVLSHAIFCTMAGYAFAKYRFRWKGVLFALVLATIMVPGEMLILPWYQRIVDLGWQNTYQGLLFPIMIGGFGIFLMRQFAEGVPDDLIDAARVDGMSEPGILVNVVVPLVKPAIAALSIFTFLGVWNEFLWPIIVTNKIDMWTLAMGIGSYEADAMVEYNLQMAAATIASLPLITIFLFFQSRIIEGIALTGIKG